MENIRERSNGRWQARVTFAGRSLSGTFTCKADAQKWLRITTVDLERGVLSPSRPSFTLSKVIGRYLLEVTPLHRGAVPESYILQAWQRNALGAMKLGDIKPPDVAAARDRRLQEVSSGSVRRELDALSAVFTHAMKEWQLCDNNPCMSIRKPPHGRPRDRRLIPGELERVIAASESPDMATIAALAVESALRRSEILGLEWKHIDLKRRVAHLPLTKNGSARDVPLSTKAAALLDALPRRIDGKVFKKNGTSLSGAFTRAVRRARCQYEAECKAQGVAVNAKFLVALRLHDLRHEATTRFFEGGRFDMMEVASITGHKTLSMLKRYTHLSAEALALKMA